MSRFKIVLLLLALGSCQEKTDLKAEGEKVMQVSREWSQAAASGDMQKVLSYWADDAVVIMAGQPAYKGKEQIAKMLEETSKIPGFKIGWEPQSVQISDKGDMAYLVEDMQMSFSDSTGQIITQRNRAVTIWRKQADGSWKNVVDISTPDLPGQ